MDPVEPRIQELLQAEPRMPATVIGERVGWRHSIRLLSGWVRELRPLFCRRIAARDAHGGEGRIRAARFPARKSLEEFDFDHARGLKRDVVADLGTLDFVAARENVCSSARPAPARPTSRSGYRSAPAKPGTGCCSPPPPNGWVARLADAYAAGRLQAELVRLGRYPPLVIDEVDYIPFEAEAANLFFQLVSSRYERRSSSPATNRSAAGGKSSATTSPPPR